MARAGDKPESFSIRERDIRKANLRRFPYYFLFRVVGREVRFSSAAITITIGIHLSDRGVDSGIGKVAEPSGNSATFLVHPWTAMTFLDPVPHPME
jgi:hypothetical protein